MRALIALVAAAAFAATGAAASAAPLAAASSLTGRISVEGTATKVQYRGGRQSFRGGGGGALRWPQGGGGRSFARSRGAPRGAVMRGGVRRPIPNAAQQRIVRRAAPNAAQRRIVRRAAPNAAQQRIVRRPSNRSQVARLEQRRRVAGIPNRRIETTRRRAAATAGPRLRRGGHVAGPRHFRRGRWHRGEPKWVGSRRFHRGHYWRRAHDGWYYWLDSAWFWAPTFGIIIGAGYPYYDDYLYDTVVIEPWTDAWFDYCRRRYISFDPATGYYMTYRGVRRFCVYVG